MLCVLQSLVDPGLEHFGAHLNLLVFALEASALWLHFLPTATKCTVIAAWSHGHRLAGLHCSRFAACPALGLTRSEIEVCPFAWTMAILAMHLLSQLLRHD